MKQEELIRLWMKGKKSGTASGLKVYGNELLYKPHPESSDYYLLAEKVGRMQFILNPMPGKPDVYDTAVKTITSKVLTHVSGKERRHFHRGVGSSDWRRIHDHVEVMPCCDPNEFVYGMRDALAMRYRNIICPNGDYVPGEFPYYMLVSDVEHLYWGMLYCYFIAKKYNLLNKIPSIFTGLCLQSSKSWRYSYAKLGLSTYREILFNSGHVIDFVVSNKTDHVDRIPYLWWGDPQKRIHDLATLSSIAERIISMRDSARHPVKLWEWVDEWLASCNVHTVCRVQSYAMTSMRKAKSER